MPLELYMVGLVSWDIEKSREFYERLGLEMPERSDGETHIEVKLRGNLTSFINAPGRAGIQESPRIVHATHPSAELFA